MLRNLDCLLKSGNYIRIVKVPTKQSATEIGTIIQENNKIESFCH